MRLIGPRMSRISEKLLGKDSDFLIFMSKCEHQLFQA